MLMSAIEAAQSALTHPELAGKRVLITGLTSSCGVDLARGFAEHKARLILQFAEESENMQAVAEIAARSALDIKAYGPVEGDAEAIVTFSRVAVQAFGGLDAVINLVPLTAAGLQPGASEAEIERLIAARLALPYLISKIAANRMSMMMAEGMILNIATLTGAPAAGARAAFAGVVKAAMTGMTRAQAEEWAGRGIRFNAVAPQTVGAQPGLSGEGDVARLALYLVAGRGKAISGCVFEAECAR